MADEFKETTDQLYKLVGLRVASARATAGYSQNQLHRKLNVSRTTVVNMEKGRQHPPLALLWRLANLLEIEVTDLIPSMSEIADTDRSVHLDNKTIAMIEEAATDDPTTRRRLSEFIQDARTKLDGRQARKERNASKH